MSRNSRLIDYRLRLGKYVERKMLCAAFHKLSSFYPLHSYKYIGFGAYYFVDFYLFHKELGIEDMLSIEQSMAMDTQKRYNFNKPFECINIDFRDSKDVLPEETWDKPAIVWLDYIVPLNSNVLNDLDTVIRGAMSGSILVISINMDPQSYDPTQDSDQESRLGVFKEKIGENYIVRDLTQKDLTPKNIHGTYSKIIRKAIQNILFERNSVNEEADDLEWKQLFHFKYSDGAPMYSYGGVIVGGKEHSNRLDHIEFDKFNFIRKSEDLFEIDVPNLTIKEIKFLESHMPSGINEDGSIKMHTENPDAMPNPKIPNKDIVKFSKIYKYFPTFAEARIG